MSVARAIANRRSVRQFLPHQPVPDAVIRELLELATRSPSGGNVQPWEMRLISGSQRDEFVAHVAQQAPTGPEYDIYPSELADPFSQRRTQCTEDMYASINVQRTDRPAKLAHVQRNFTFFDAPSAVLFTLKRYMGPPQWADVGMFMQTFMLLCEERGIATCAQEAWANHSAAIKQFFAIGEEDIVFCCIAVGYADPNAPINTLRTRRAGVDEIIIAKL